MRLQTGTRVRLRIWLKCTALVEWATSILWARVVTGVEIDQCGDAAQAHSRKVDRNRSRLQEVSCSVVSHKQIRCRIPRNIQEARKTEPTRASADRVGKRRFSPRPRSNLQWKGDDLVLGTTAGPMSASVVLPAIWSRDRSMHGPVRVRVWTRRFAIPVSGRE